MAIVRPVSTEEVSQVLKICHAAGQNVVTHGGLLAAALKALLEVPARRHPFVLHNGSITQLSLSDGQVQLISANRIDHLRNVGFGGRGDL